MQLDDGSALELVLLSAPIRSGQSLVQGLRAWFLVTVCGALLALAIGSGLAARLLAPLNALLEGTAAMARGHLMVRLPTGRGDELGSLTREFNRMADEIRNTYLGMISTLAEIVEAKSHYTREHIDRVERLAMATAEVLERRGWVRFSSHQRFLLSVAAILHDVGKIAIANEILNKSGPLDTTEREQILTHPEVGALIVERMGKLERAAEIIRCAHEHFDGSGYPRGLRGEEIPLESAHHPGGGRVRCDDHQTPVLRGSLARVGYRRAARRGRAAVRSGRGGGAHRGGDDAERRRMSTHPRTAGSTGSSTPTRTPATAWSGLPLRRPEHSQQSRLRRSASRSAARASMTRRSSGSVFDGRTLNHQSGYCDGDPVDVVDLAVGEGLGQTARSSPPCPRRGS